MHSKARWIADWPRRSSRPRIRTSTSVPRSGRSRRCSASGECNIEDCQNAAYPFGDMLARKGCAADVSNIFVELKCVSGMFPDKLGTPSRVPDLAAEALAIYENLDAEDDPRRVERDRIGDELMLPVNFIDDDKTKPLSPGQSLPKPMPLDSHSRPGALLDLPDLLAGKLQFFLGERFCVREEESLHLFDGKKLRRMRGGDQYRDTKRVLEQLHR